MRSRDLEQAATSWLSCTPGALTASWSSWSKVDRVRRRRTGSSAMSAANAAAAPLPFSVIIPTLNEVEQIADTLSAARRAFGASAEYIVVDGGSRDGTPDAARALGAIVLTGPAGR